MNRFQRTSVALASVLLSIAGAALAGDETKSKAADTTADKGYCACDKCALFKADVEVLISKLLENVAPATFCEGTRPETVAWLRAHPSRLYARAIGGRQNEIESSLERMKTRFLDPATTNEQRTRLLDVVAFFPKQANAQITVALWKSAPAAFTTDHMTVFAAYGCEPLVAELRERAKSDVLAAAYFGVRGDDCGKKTLLTAYRKLDVAHGVIADPAVAALGLAGLGEDKPLLRLQDTLRDTALAALDGGNLEAAKCAALAAEMIAKLAKAPGKAELGSLASSLEWHALSRGAELASADDVFKLLEGLSS